MDKKGFLPGEIVWLLPICYWEDKNPIECLVTKKESEDGFVYVEHSEYMHEVFVRADKVFHYKNSAIKTIEYLTAIKDISGSDVAHKIVDRIKQKKNGFIE